MLKLDKASINALKNRQFMTGQRQKALVLDLEGVTPAARTGKKARDCSRAFLFRASG
jgi:hypothetical protein